MRLKLKKQRKKAKNYVMKLFGKVLTMQTFSKKKRTFLLGSIFVFLLVGCSNYLWKEDLFFDEPEKTLVECWLQSGINYELNSLQKSAFFWRFVIGINMENPYEQLLNGFPILKNKYGRATNFVTEEENFSTSAFVTNQWKHQFKKIKEIALTEETEILLYHTHNAETYLPSAGVSKVNGKNGGVVQAAEIFQKALQEKYGIKTVHDTTLHDYPNWNRSYQNSLLTVQQLLKANPKVHAVFDIHRDAGFTSKKPTTVEIHGRSAARIMLVIGANHTSWKENLAFARELEMVCNQLYPGLLRDQIRIKETGRYNQQVNSHAILLEIGSDLNTQEEADYAMECFAQVVFEVLQEEHKNIGEEFPQKGA